ncbi:hypothetical protein SDC9_183301 [bioreactor metagenome]|uniref:Uncharacterized protein n=1 Tax=bioreactor metagenome TaxID=1076179 RepID=A0A645HCF2_9ZZZZ|nr:hypothetical protein [Christensenella sp.]
MAYEKTGMQALFPVYFSRMAGEGASREEYDIACAQNEGNLNQNLETIYRKLSDLEDFLAVLE